MSDQPASGRRRVAVVYATDFGEVSPGGIQSFVRVVGEHAPPELDVVYVGLGRLGGPLPRAGDTFVSMGVPDGRRSVNGHFTAALLRRPAVLDGVDAVVIHRPEHVLALHPRRVPRLALMLHGGTWNAWRARRGAFGAGYPVLEAVAARRAAVTMAVASTHLARSTVRAGRVVDMPTTYDASSFTPPGARPVARNRVLLVGRLVPEKRFDLALRAVATLGTTVEVEIFGSGPEDHRLRELARALGLEATFHGAVTPLTLAAAHRRGDGVLVLTSRFEGFPVAALEAAACGTPVVGVAAPGVSESLPAFGGVLAPGTDQLPRVLSEALRGEHEVNAAAVCSRFGPAAVSARFWELVLHG